MVDLMKMTSIFKAQHEEHMCTLSRERREERKAYFTGDALLTKAYRAVNAKFTAPIMFLRRTSIGRCGEAIGTYATSLSELDKILADAWGKIYHGTCQPLVDIARNFCGAHA